MKGFFITGTGTDIGKTFVTASLCHQLRAADFSVRPVKPVLSGYSDENLQGSDTAILLRATGQTLSQSTIDATSPWRFAAPLAPNMAAARQGKRLNFTSVHDFCQKALQGPEEFCLIEGAGGAFSPLTDDRLNIDLAAALNIPLIVVSGSYLGAIGHAIATLEAIQARKVAIHCLIVSESTESPVPLAETIAALSQNHPQIAIYGLPFIHQKDNPWQFADPVISAILGTE